MSYRVLLILLVMTSVVRAEQIMQPQAIQAIQDSLPTVVDDDANQLLHSGKIIWYDTASMPPMYQHSGAAHSPYYNISADPSDSHLPHGSGGNAGAEFPWKVGKPGGGHLAIGLRSFKGFYFPKPAAVFNRIVNGRVGSGRNINILDWVFADGTVFVEVLYQQIRDEHVCFEIRTRTKEGDEWAVDIFRPFATAEELADALEELEPGGTRQNHLRQLAIAELRDETLTLEARRLVDAMHTRENAFDVTTEVYSLPRLVTVDVEELLDREFVSCLGMNFKGRAAAPSNDSEFVSLVPPNYHGAFVGNDRIGCANCHDSAGRHSTEFQHPRGWYGRVPGSYSDKINSWHPLEPSSISYNGANRQMVLRRQFVSDGLIVFVRNQLPAGYKFTKVD